jgi:hypothetical protein
VLRPDTFKQERVVPGALRAVEAGTGLGHKLRIVLGKRRGGQLQQNVVLDPFPEMANGQQNPFRCAAVPIALLPAGRQSFLLLLGLKLGEQERVAHSDLVFRKGFDDCRGQFGQANPRSNVPWLFAAFCRDLLNGIGRFFQMQQRGEALRLLQRMYVPPLKVLDDRHFERLSVAEVGDANRHIADCRQLRRPVAPRPGNNLIGLWPFGPHQERRKYALGADAFGVMFRKRLCGRCGGKPHGCWRCAF